MKSFILIYIILIFFINCINGENITITIGERGLSFSPQIVTARYNDAIKWVFTNGKHQVVQSDGPAGSCVKSTNSSAFASTLQQGGEFNYIIKQNSGTIHYFCSFSSHCAYGMWGMINIDTSSPTAMPSTSDITTNTPTPYNNNSEPDNLPIIIGSSIGGFFALAILGLIIFMLYRRNKYQKQFEVSMQPYDSKMNVNGGGRNNENNGGNNIGNNSSNSRSNSNIGVPAPTSLPLDNNNPSLLSRSNTYDDHSTNEVIMHNIAPNTQLNDETIRNFEERASSEYSGAAMFRGSSQRESLYQYNIVNDGERSERSSRSPMSLSPPLIYLPTQNTVYNPYDNNDVIYKQQQNQPVQLLQPIQQQQQQPIQQPIQQQPIQQQQQQQQPPVPPRPIISSQQPPPQQFGVPYLPPRPIAVNRYPPQYGPSSSPTFQEAQYNISSDPFGPSNTSQYYHRQSIPLPPPPPTQPLPPPPTQQQTVQYTIDPAQYYGSNNDN